MPHPQTSWFNLERGGFVGMTALLLYTVYHAYITTQPLPQNPLATSVFSSDDAAQFAGEQVGKYTFRAGVHTKRGDIFIPHAINAPWLIATQTKRTRLTASRPSLNVNSGGAVVTKPKVDKRKSLKDKKSSKLASPIEPPFPLKVAGFIKLSRETNEMLALVFTLKSPGDIRRLRVGDEWELPNDNIKVVNITVTSITFQRQDGRLHTIDKNPLKAWHPSLSGSRNGKPPAVSLARARNAGRVHRPRGFGLNAPPRNNARNRSSRDTPAVTKILRDNSTKNARENPLNEKEVQKILKKLKAENPDLLNNLGDIY